MPSVQDEILNKLKAGPKGKILFTSDFINLGGDDAIRQTLSRITKEGKITKLAQGIYLYPI